MANRKLKKFSTSEDDGSASWANLNHDLLFIIMMRVGVFDFIALSGVCKAWRSVAHSYWNKFMVSRQPMLLYISTRLNKKDCYLEDYKRRKFKTTIPRSNGRLCVGVTCGYLIFFGKKTKDFWLVNPFTRKQLYFPGFPFAETTFQIDFRGILVFSPSMSGWVFVVTHKYSNVISFSLAGKQVRWRSISSDPASGIYDLHFFKGKIYMINTIKLLWELRLDSEPTLILHKMKNLPWPDIRNLGFVSSRENLYVRDVSSDVFMEVDFGEMKWVNPERTIGEHAVFISDFKCDAAIKPDTWIHPWTHYKRLNYCYQSNIPDRCLTRKLWYFPHDCLNNDNDSDMENGALVKNTLVELSKKVGGSSSSG